jgi:large subunit ribosomal protein L28
MARICHSCGKRPAFGQSRSHSMVATKRRFVATIEWLRLWPNAGFFPQL